MGSTLLAATSYFNPIPENIDSSYLLSYFYDFHGHQPNCIGVTFVDVGTNFGEKIHFHHQVEKLL
ncbi:hypothetical protein [Nostoc sp. NOS(2021)]|uniref:hypothetical protein n=1 Tax=Nostoc sp. NOS(2021) TaxID=2815407 RepID=UPI0025F50BA3|nr:hypothetical protein [Nostoc sp. NOS(2021)]